MCEKDCKYFCSLLLWVVMALCGNGGGNTLTVPPYYRTAGVINWYLHTDRACQQDAKLHCQSLYKNGRLLIMENDETANLVFEQYSSTTEDDVYIGYQKESDDGTFLWNTCDRLNASQVNYAVFIGSSSCMFVKMSQRLISTVVCNSEKTYMCEESNNDAYCAMEKMINTFATVTNATKEDDCVYHCQKIPSCWGTFFINAICFLLQNVEESSNMIGVMYRKDCMQNVSITTTSVLTDTCMNSRTTPVDECKTEYTVPVPGPGSDSFPQVPLYTETFTTTEYQTVTKSDVRSITLDCIETPLQVSCDPVVSTVQQRVTLTVTSNIQPSYVTVTQMSPSSASVECAYSSVQYKNYTTEELRAKINELTMFLKVVKTSTTSHVRKLSSAQDNRPSVQAVGWTGVVIICMPFCIMVLCDVTKYNECLKSHIRKRQEASDSHNPVVNRHAQ